MRPEEKKLIERCQRGDKAAFNELILNYEKRVFNLAFRLTGNYDDANDVASETFVRVYNAIARFRGDSAFTTWIYRIATNVYLDSRKRKLAHSHLSLEEYLELEEGSLPRQIEDSSPGPQYHAEERERSDILQAAINELPEYQRVIVVLYHIHGVPYEEIAEVLQMPLGTIKSRLNRARRTLREKLESQKELFGT